MNTFKVGEICIGQNLKIDVGSNGMECEILECLEWTEWIDDVSGCEGEAMMYFVRWADGIESAQFPHELRRKTPPASTADMREYEDLIARLTNRKEQTV